MAALPPVAVRRGSPHREQLCEHLRGSAAVQLAGERHGKAQLFRTAQAAAAATTDFLDPLSARFLAPAICHGKAYAVFVEVAVGIVRPALLEIVTELKAEASVQSAFVKRAELPTVVVLRHAHAVNSDAARVSGTSKNMRSP